MLRREFIKPTSSMRLLLTTVLFILLMINSLFSQSERPNSVVTPISSIGELSENRKLILQNTLTDELKEHFKFVKLNKVFSDPFGLIEEEINLENCYNDICMKRVQNIFHVENVFHLQLIEVVDGTQMNLKWMNLEEKRNEEEFCEVCGIQEMRKIVVSLVNNLLVIEKELDSKVGDIAEVQKEDIVYLLNAMFLLALVCL